MINNFENQLRSKLERQLGSELWRQLEIELRLKLERQLASQIWSQFMSQFVRPLRGKLGELYETHKS